MTSGRDIWRSKLCRSMRIILFVLFAAVSQVFATDLYSQSTRLSLDMKNTEIKDVLEVIESRTSFFFMYNAAQVDVTNKVNIQCEDMSVPEILDVLFRDTNVAFDINNRQIALTVDESISLRQSGAVSGRVTDPAGLPLPGVTVVIKGTAQGTITDNNGNYSIANVPENAVLVFSFVGMKSQEVLVRGKPTVNAIMEESMIGVEEVVVVAYGSQMREALTGAISAVKTDKIETTTNPSLAQKLAGKVAGLNIRNTTGEPGTFSNTINIRGFTGNPLYVIDGIPRGDSQDFQKLTGSDIESITVLKDGSAAIYGLNGANGVILVTTKRASKNTAPTFTYDFTGGISKPTDRPRMASASEYAQMRNDAALFMYGGGSPYYTKEELQNWINGAPGYESTDWWGLTMKNHATTQRHYLSVTGGTESTQYFTSFNYQKDKGLYRSEDLGYNQYNFRSNLTTNLSSNLKAEIFVSGRYDKRYTPGEDYIWVYFGSILAIPTLPAYVNNNKDYPGIGFNNRNSIILSDKDYSGYKITENRNITTTFALTYNVPGVKGLSVKATGAYDFNSYQYKELYKGWNYYRHDAANDKYIPLPQRSGSESLFNANNNAATLTLQANINYNRIFAEKHAVGATLVFEQREGDSRYNNLRRYYSLYTIDQVNTLPRSSRPDEVQGMESESAMQSYAGRLNYGYNNKFFMEFAFRYDGAYQYNPDERWDFFPVVSGGYRISEENFFKLSFPVISELKIRGSYGELGENAGAAFQYMEGFNATGGGGYEFSDGTWTTGAQSPSIVNKNLTWIRAKTSDIGFDLGLWKNSFNLKFDVYQRDREGLLATRAAALPNTFGGTMPQENLNSDRVRGFDIEVGYKNKIDDFQYNISGNLNLNRRKTIHVERGGFTNSYDRWRNSQENRWSDVLWAYTYKDRFTSDEDILNSPFQSDRSLPGDYKYEDVNGDGVLNGLDAQPIFRNATPLIHYGFSLGASWKNFDFNAVFQGMADYTLWFTGVYGQIFAFQASAPAYFFDRWHKADPYDPNSEWIPGKFPASRLPNDQGTLTWDSSRTRFNASFLRVKSMELGYSFNLKNAGIQDLRIYVNAYNLYTFTDKFVKYFDPEKVAGASDSGLEYPLNVMYNFGVSVKF